MPVGPRDRERKGAWKCGIVEARDGEREGVRESGRERGSEGEWKGGKEVKCE